MKKCKKCKGQGFTFDKISLIEGMGLKDIGIKVPCTNCYGKGEK